MNLIDDYHMQQAEISKHDQLVNKVNKMQASIRYVLELSEVFEVDSDGNPPFTAAMSTELNRALEL